MTKLRIRLLGGVQATAASGAAVALPAKKVQALLAYLASQPGRAHARGRLAALLWGDSGDATGRASLRQALLVLRRSLGLDAAALVAGPGETITWSAICADVDVVSFEALASDPTRVAEAAALYAGEFAESLETRAPDFDEWLRTRREQLRERALVVFAQRLADERAAGHTDAAVQLALRLLALDPLQEPVHRALMQLYARQGRAASALRQYELCREALRRELGAAPQPETLALRAAIERDRSAPPHMSDPAEAAGGAEIRHVAVVFAEFDGAEADDPEQALALGESFAARAGEIVALYGGRADRGSWATLTGWFGVPRAHGDDTLRAARCALRLCEAIDGLRVGVAVGTVLVDSAAGGRVAGEAAGAAARLAAVAAPGEVLVSDAAWRLLAPHAKGRANERPVGGAAPARRLAALHAAGAPPHPLVGRRGELRQFASALRSCRETGAGLTLHLRGEPGIGKTRLVDEFAALAAADGFVCHVGRVLDFGQSAERDALPRIVRDLLGDPTADDDSTLVARAIADGLTDTADEVHLHDLLQHAQPGPLQSGFDAMDHAARERGRRETLAALLRRAAARRPQLLAIDDLHWADERTLALAAALAGAVEHCPALLVTTARSEQDPLGTAWRHRAGVQTLLTLDLGPLPWADADRLAAQIAPSADAFRVRCVDRAGGNPLFLEQLLRGDPDAETALPAAVQNVVLARLDRITGAERRAARVASVLGQRFPLAALRTLLGAGVDAALPLAEGLLRVDDTTSGLFVHALVHDATYASLPRSEREALHRRAALWFTGRDPALRAAHLDRAGDPAAAAAYLAASDAERAAHRYEQALRFVERGLALAADGERFAHACARADLLADTGAVAEAARAYDDAFAEASDEAERCRAWLGIAGVRRVRGDADGALEVLALAERAAAPRRWLDMLAQVHFVRGNLLFPRGDFAGCVAEHERSLSLAREIGAAEQEAAALGGLGDAEYMRGRFVSATARFTDCVARARQHGLARIEAANLPMAAFCRWWSSGDARAALDETLAAVDLARRIGHRRAEMVARHCAFQCAFVMLEPGAAAEHAERAIVLARDLDAPHMVAEGLAFRAQLRATRGEASAALADAREALALSRGAGMSYLGPAVLAVLGGVTDDPCERAAALDEGEQLLAGNRLIHNHLMFRRDAIEATLRAGDAAAARRHADALAAVSADEPLFLARFHAAGGRALAAWLDGERGAGVSAELEGLREQARVRSLYRAAAAVDDALAAPRG
jgi:DNA-binding SARP family transcriptional activator